MSSNPQVENTQKTREDVERLKANWCDDPCYDLEDVEGFEEFHDELLAFSTEQRQKWEATRAEERKERGRSRTPEELRNDTNGQPAFWFREIAAQLSAANELKRMEIEAAITLGKVLNLFNHEASPLSKLAGSAESIAVSLDILVNRGRL